MKKFLAVIITIFCLALSNAGAKTRTSKSVKQQKQATEQKIRQTDAQIKENARQMRSKLNDLNRLQAETQTITSSITTLQATIDSLDIVAQAARDSAAVLDNKLSDLKSVYADILRSTRRSRSSMSNLTFIFSSDSFTQAFRRANALKQFSHWRQRKVNQINDLKAQLDERQRYVDSLAEQNRQLAHTMSLRRTELSRRASETDALVNSLKGKDADLRRVLRDQQQQAAALERELDKIIREEQRRAAEEARRKAAEEEKKRRAAEEEARRKAAEEAKNKANNKSDGTTAQPAPAQPAQPAKPQPAQPAPKAPETLSSSGFAANRGRLSYPVNPHTIVRRFGRQQHPVHKHVMTDNAGIDLETSSGAPVKCVYDGEVSAIFCPDGYNNVVLVRHGTYLTVYANLGSLSVHKGDKVKTGQQLGTVFADPSDNNRSILHFEIRNAGNAKSVTKENPEQWLR